MRLIWLTIGLLSLALGAAGIFVPLLPTVPFILLSAFCFARSSERLHDWLLNHRVFGPMIDDWHRSGAIRPRIKVIATLTMAGFLSISVLAGFRPMVVTIQAITLCCVLVFIWSRPSA